MPDLLARWRHRPQTRTLLLAFGVLVVSTTYVLLLSTSETIVARVEGELQRHWRVPYHLLVRAPDSVLPWEQKWGLARTNDLVALPPKITFDQYRIIQDLPGVEVAAPISVVGYFNIPLTHHLGLETIHLDDGWYRVRRIWILNGYGSTIQFLREWYFWQISAKDLSPDVRERVRRMAAFVINPAPGTSPLYRTKFSWEERFQIALYENTRISSRVKLASPYPLALEFSLPLVLVGLDFEKEHAIGSKINAQTVRPLHHAGYCVYTSRDPVGLQMFESEGTRQEIRAFAIPVLVRYDGLADVQGLLQWQKLRPPQNLEAFLRVLESNNESLVAQELQSLPSIGENHQRQFHLQSVLHQWAATSTISFLGEGNGSLCNPGKGSPHAVPYIPPDVPPDALIFQRWQPWYHLWLPKTQVFVERDGSRWTVRPKRLEDHPLNPLEEPVVRLVEVTPSVVVKPLVLGLVGSEDFERPEKNAMLLPALGLYEVPEVQVLAIDGQPLSEPTRLKPGLTPLGYLPPPPAMLTTLEAACAILGEQCISAIRVKVAGVEEFSPQAQAKIEAVAAEIMRRTGLHVDVVAGASPRPMQVHLPGAGQYPDLLLQELWIQKGVHLTIHRTVQKGNQALFGFLLALTVLYTANAGAMWVMGDLWKWALRRALGWRDRTVLLALLGQGLTVGLVAGTLGLLLGWGLKVALGLQMEAARLWPILPLSVGLVLLGLVVPAVAASRTPPLPVLTGRWWTSARPRTGLWARWLGLLAHHPRELVLAGLMVAGATGLLTLVMAGLLAFRGYLALTLLGQYLLVRLGPAHGVLLGVTLLVTALGIVDVVLLLLERHGYLTGLLQALGWRPREVRDYWVRHGLALALVGGVPGGLGALALLTAGLGWRWAYPVAGLAAVALVAALAVLAAWLPARRAVQRPPVEVLRTG